MSRKAKQEWAITVRLADGSRLYYCVGSDQRGGQIDWGPRESQAHRFATHEDAQAEVATFVVNSRAWEYKVVRLPRSDGWLTEER